MFLKICIFSITSYARLQHYFKLYFSSRLRKNDVYLKILINRIRISLYSQETHKLDHRRNNNNMAAKKESPCQIVGFFHHLQLRWRLNYLLLAARSHPPLRRARCTMLISWTQRSKRMPFKYICRRSAHCKSALYSPKSDEREMDALKAVFGARPITSADR